MSPSKLSPARQPVFVLVGGTGDLALRMLWPSLAMLDQDGFLSDDVRVISVAREAVAKKEFLGRVQGAIEKRIHKDLEDGTLDRFLKRVSHVALDASDPEWGNKLKAELGDIDALDIVYFLSVSPTLFKPICEHLEKAGLSHAPNRVIIEKPLGRDLASSKVINDSVAHAFAESRTFRIDHYLGKETVQNLLALRFANTVFEPLWNAQSIDHVQVSVSETVGTGDRLGYYDEYGALRDMVQNHLLQLVCLLAMEPPSNFNSDALRDEKVKVLRSLKPITADVVKEVTARGQYGAGFAEGHQVAGYEAEKGSPSNTETYVAIKAEVANWRWSGTPFYLRTGKALPSRTTEIVIQFRAVPHSIFGAAAQPNRLVIRLQPDEDIRLTVMNKAPGLSADGMQLQPLDLSLSLTNAFDANGDKPARRRIAYERLILDALNGNNAAFVRRDEVEAAWTWIDGISAAWAEAYAKPQLYPAGTNGPMSAYMLLDRDKRVWND
ncbi:glucose-6-phosphate dehydrogenase [Asticcacaulis sp. YBE204]|uniref:glucose-6-phosphate dehydrogenase n=1 Tax=Asticcacaulis sp. YBE204 TaxID=1282363 RepID=UPI0003C3EBDD|nr:glucose-6-phosphate dehydrogenase [Asticcacaulis sp. YBE204]ESQ79485.1 glucose 6-phosphate dehydrogenase [Asticcacaulis sp. YBE204]